MRHRVYLRKYLNTGMVEEFYWSREHYREAGFSEDFDSMPLLEAYQLVNKWNISQADPQQYVYALKEN